VEEAARVEMGLGPGLGDLGDGMEDMGDLDDLVPDADGEDFGTGSSGSDSGDGSEGDDGEEENTGTRLQQQESVPRGVLASRLAEDVFREAILRGTEGRNAVFGAAVDGNVTDEEDQEGMLQEEDLVRERIRGDGDTDMDLGVDLDADVPEAEEEYEHTDTDEELESSTDGNSIFGGVRRESGENGRSQVRSDGTQNSLDLNGVMGVYSSSQLGSPRQGSPLRSRRA